jgi:tetratricopeptide (TPR) repeat protein
MEPPASSPARPDRLARLAPLLIVATGFVAYANSFAVPFQFDDLVVLVKEPTITGFRLDPASWRYLGHLSFALSWRAFGEQVAGHHAVNLAIHLANALLVWRLTRLLWRTPALAASRLAPRADRVALLAALLFVAHPLQTQAVTYIVQRYASLAALFFLSSVCAYLTFRLSPPGWRARGWYVLFLASAVAAPWTKENALVLPIAVAAAEWIFFEAPLRRRAILLSPFLGAAAAGLVLALASGLDPARMDALSRVDSALARSDYLLTQLRVVASYLRLLALPVGQNLDHDVAISTSLLEPAVLLSLALHLALLGGAAYAILGASRRDPAWRLAGFGVIWFYVALLVESSVIPIADVMYEHRVYLPSAGVFLLAATGLGALPQLASARAWRGATLALAGLLAALTFARNGVWRDDLSLWSDAATKSPNKARAINNLGVARFVRGDYAAAASLFERAVRADPSYEKAWFNLGTARHRLGDYEGAIGPYERFRSAAPDYPETYANLADCYFRTWRPERAAAMRAGYEQAKAALGSAPPRNFLR